MKSFLLFAGLFLALMYFTNPVIAQNAASCKAKEAATSCSKVGTPTTNLISATGIQTTAANKSENCTPCPPCPPECCAQACEKKTTEMVKQTATGNLSCEQKSTDGKFALLPPLTRALSVKTVAGKTL